MKDSSFAYSGSITAYGEVSQFLANFRIGDDSVAIKKYTVNVKLKIRKVSDGMYLAESISSQPDVPSASPEWTIPGPMHPHDLCRELLGRGFAPSDISDAFEEAGPDLSPTSRNYVPTVGEEVLVVNHLGIFVVEEIDAKTKTASLRVLRSGLLMKDVEWCTIWPLDDKLRARFTDIIGGLRLQQILSRRNRDND